LRASAWLHHDPYLDPDVMSGAAPGRARGLVEGDEPHLLDGIVGRVDGYINRASWAGKAPDTSRSAMITPVPCLDWSLSSHRNR